MRRQRSAWTSAPQGGHVLPRDVSALTSTLARKVSLRSRQVLIIGTALTCILALGLSFRAGALDSPLARDEGAYAYIGANLTSGIVPYRDAFDHKPPGIYLFYAAASIGPDKVTSIRLATDVLFAASIRWSSPSQLARTGGQPGS